MISVVQDNHCGCGCGKPCRRQFVKGHNRRIYRGREATPTAAHNRWQKNNRETYNVYRKNFYRRRKLKAMALLGNRCEICGLKYNGKNAPVFEFDHLNPDEKEFGITRMMNNLTWERVEKEIKKCRLLCANCHNQWHGGEW